jgi:hypothetical protein
MIRLLLIAAILMTACNDGDDRNTDKDPATVQPPEEAIPDSAKIINDSLIVPDSARHHE